ncbi:MAG: hypothetical protein Q9191_005226 [Dirinaria sp. TL-2023a]
MQSNGLEKTEIGTALNITAVEKPMNYPFASKLGSDTSSKTLAKGGASWKVLDSQEAVRLEVSSEMESSINIGVNWSAIPKHLYHLSLRPFTISVVLRWSSDLVEKGLNLAFPGADQIGKTYRTLNQLAPEKCVEVVRTANALSGLESTKDDFLASLDNLINVTEYSSLARFRVSAWKLYFEDKSQKITWRQPEQGQDTKQGTEEASKDQLDEFSKRILDSIRMEAKLMPSEDLGQDLSSKSPFTVSADNKTLLEGGDVDKCFAAMGHGFIESYTEKASMAAVWTLTLPGASEEQFYAFRIAIQKYFLQPRGISEACEFLSLPAKDIFDPAPEVKVSIFGYCDRSSHSPEDILDKPPSVAATYLKPQILARNTERQSIRVRAWKGLDISGLPDSSQLKNMAVPELDEFFVLNVRKAERLLLLLLLYSKVPDSHVDKRKLAKFGQQLDKVFQPDFLEPAGTLSGKNRDFLNGLVRHLEEALPAGDPEKDQK